MPRRALRGNWFEEEAYERDRRLLMQGRDGCLVDASTEVANIAAKVTHHSTPHELAAMPADGCLRFYRPLMLQNAGTLGYMSLDLDDRKKAPTGWQVGSSTAPANEATLRNTVILVPAPMPPTTSFPVPADEADMLHYGQPFYIMTPPSLCPDPLSLMSEFKSPTSASRVTGRHQAVFFSPDGGSAAAMWCADYADPGYQEDYRDHPVKVDDVIILRHNMTNAPLVSVKEVYFNDFGAQYEVGCSRVLSYASKRKAGPVADENIWMFIHSGQGAEMAEPPGDAK